ncbi:hypothetical protein FYC62_03115 [Pedobacter aquae]|uniref:Uncharacterized protein n=1 Tax=Pedobacter aquae TaxID=2605747 RepID=A0A5C0VHR4_9SPHI|nr:hypothetical protein [Pedobacter aquae]QEK50770.1 hypothetical protein FYC62_03115 [Pedobacter aquae]
MKNIEKELYAMKLDKMVDDLNLELQTSSVYDIIYKLKITDKKTIELKTKNVFNPNLSFRELFRGKLYSMILIRLKTRFLNFYRSNGEPLWLVPVYRIGKFCYLFLMPLALSFSSILIVDEFYKNSRWS